MLAIIRAGYAFGQEGAEEFVESEKDLSGWRRSLPGKAHAGWLIWAEPRRS
jgi:hypothetical protein